MASNKSEVEHGWILYNKIMSKSQAYHDTELQAYVNEIGRRLVEVSDRPDLRFTFTLMDEAVVNAYALPGGFIFVNRGLLSYLNTEDQLAAVIAHEIGHIAARHHAKGEHARRAANVLGGLASITTQYYTGNNVLSALPSYVGQSLVSGYGRKAELTADKLGSKYLTLAGYNHKAMLETLSILKQQELFQKKLQRDKGGRAPSYHGVFSTHPKKDKRLHQVIAESKKLPRVTDDSGPVGDYLSKIHGLSYGRSTVSGFNHDNRFYDRSMATTFAFPDNWFASVRGAKLLGHPNVNPQDAYIFVRIHPGDSIRQSPLEYIQRIPGVESLQSSREVSVAGFKGVIADVVSAKQSFEKRRVAMLYGNGRYYVFVGAVTQVGLLAEWLTAFHETMHSLRPLPADEGFQVAQTHVRVHTVKTGETYQSLLPPGAPKTMVDRLRLLNDHYPRGEPSPAQRIKVLN